MRVHCVALNLGQRVCGLLIVYTYHAHYFIEEKELPDEKLMSVPLMLDNSEPANTLMTLMESKKFKQMVGKMKSKQSGTTQTYLSASESSDNDETPHLHPRPHRSAQAPQTATADALHIDENEHQHFPPHANAHRAATVAAYTQVPHGPHAEASDIDETPHPRKRRHPVQSQVPHTSENWDEEMLLAVVPKVKARHHETLQSHHHHLNAAQYGE